MDINTAKHKIWSLMDINNLLPDEEDYFRIRNIINSRGRKRLDEIVCIIGKDSYTEICSAYKQNFISDDLARILGFGDCLTEYLICPLSLESHEKETAIKLGALANLIVTLFDTFIDNGKKPSDILSGELLKDLSLNRFSVKDTLITNGNIHNSPEKITILALVREYFNIVDKIMQSGGNTVFKEKLVGLIVSMYRSEINTLNIKSFNDITDKSVLPFVVMGYSGLLWNDNIDVNECNNYVIWLYEFGSLFGILDDIVDYDDDIKFNRVNSFIHNGSVSQGIESSDLNKVIEKVLRIRGYWKEKVPFWFGVSDEVKHSCIICLISWLGGYISSNVKEIAAVK